MGIAITMPISASPVIRPAENSTPLRCMRSRVVRIVVHADRALDEMRQQAAEEDRHRQIERQIDADGGGEHRHAEARAALLQHSSMAMMAAPIARADPDHVPRQLAAEHALAPPTPSASPAAPAADSDVRRRNADAVGLASRFSTGAMTSAHETAPIASITCCRQGVAPTM